MGFVVGGGLLLSVFRLVIGLLVCGFVCGLVGCWFDCVCTFALWFVAYEWLLCCFGFGGML